MNRRVLKLNSSIQKTLMEYLLRKKKVSLPGFVSVKEVEVANDMKSAKVFLSVMHEQDCSDEVQESLGKERYFIQKSISRVLRIKFCPRLNFFVNYVPYELSSKMVRDTEQL